jgi:uncharacterized protein
LLIHGGQDTIVDPRDATLLFNAANEPKELWFLPAAGHCGAYFEDRRAYTKKVLSFFDLALNKPHLQLVESSSDIVQEEASAIQPKVRENLSEAS